MSYKSFIIFDTFSEYGHFRKFNTTTSPLSYSVPAPTALIGLLGAILGIERENDKKKVTEGNESLRDAFTPKNTRMGIRILNKVEKVNIAFNLLDTGSPQSFFNITNRTQIEYELLKNPSFRIYFDWQHPRRSELIDRIKLKQFHFNPYLGLSQFTANIIWVGERKGKQIDTNDFVPFNSILNLSLLTEKDNPVNFDLIKTQHIQVETIPLEMRTDRVITRYGEILMETSGNVITARASQQSYSVEGEGNIQLL